MKNLLFFLLIGIFSCIAIRPAYAMEDPLKSPNNRFGIHILFPEEIEDAARLVNSSGGDWGYVTIPIQSGERNLVKWQTFMDSAKKHHVIPLIRLASEGDFFNTKVWRKPNNYDLVDFANFLNSLSWPTKNKYIIVFNEVNRADEWGGKTDAFEYAEILSNAYDIFKARDENFFILPSGLDNAAANTEEAINEYDFLSQMYNARPDIFDKIDGITSHSYPNPGFSQPPSTHTTKSIASFSYERDLIKRLSGRTLPVFITETGWVKNKIPQDTIISYFRDSFLNTWTNEAVAAVTPFLLRAQAGPFETFSFINIDGSEGLLYKEYQAISKPKGNPVLEEKVLSATIHEQKDIPIKNFNNSAEFLRLSTVPIVIDEKIKILLKWLIRIE